MSCLLWKRVELQRSTPTAWDFSQDLGNLGVDLGFGDFLDLLQNGRPTDSFQHNIVAAHCLFYKKYSPLVNQ